MTSNLDFLARFVGGLILFLLGAWILHSFLGLLIWAVVLGIATWPLYQRLLRLGNNSAWIALVPTLMIGVIILGPLAYGLTQLVHESQSLVKVLDEAQKAGVVAPEWLESLPFVGQKAKNGWMAALGTPEAARETLHWFETGAAIGYSKALASQIVHRFFGILITLLALFFVYRHGFGLGQQVLDTSRKIFSDSGTRYTLHAMTAVRATVNGLVLVGLGEGLLLGAGYAIAGLNQPAMLGAVTGVLAMVPFAAKLVLGACSLVLVAQGHLTAGIGLLIFGVVVILAADNYVRPLLIGGAVQLPFLWTLLGIFGGLENFGLLGIFLGPTVMAVLMSIWRDSTEPETAPVEEA